MLRPHRVEQHIETCSLNEPAGMADIGNAPSRAIDATCGFISRADVADFLVKQSSYFT
jgi:hypothetical protein